ncbi:MAG: Na/Pi cotransporter family protein, partial [Oscillospiraceae bacterium]|nr:Na/Pi cotransporter family protein [Oscillospiraceae bacterium]
YAPVVLFIGMIMVLFLKNKKVQNVGLIVFGFGLLFMGITTMSSAIAPLKESAEFTSFLVSMNYPIVAVLVGLVFTAIVQSSSSSVGIIQTFAIQGLIDYRMAVYLVIGTSVGACMPAVIAMFASNRDGKRAAWLSIFFNLFRTVFCFAAVMLLPQIMDWIAGLSPHDVGRQIANAHTLMAIVSVLIQLPLTKQIVKLTYRVLPEREDEHRAAERKLVYISNNPKIPTAIALAQAKREVVRMGKIAQENLERALQSFFERSTEKADLVRDTEETLDYLNHAITSSLCQLRTPEMTQEEQNELGLMLLAVTDIERIGDHSDNIAEYTATASQDAVWFSDPAFKELTELADAVKESVRMALDIYENDRFDEISDAVSLEEKVDKMKETCINNHVERLMHGACNPVGGLIFTDMATDLERCSDHAYNIAETINGRGNT